MNYPRSSSLIVFSLVVLSLLFQGCQQPNTAIDYSAPANHQSETVSDPTPDRDRSEQETAENNLPESPTPAREVTYVAEKIDPVSAQLFAQSSKSRINVRSQPSTQSKAKHYGVKGDAVTLLKQATGEGNYRWYYLRFDESKAEGWIREDFVAKTPQQSASRRSYRSYNFETDPWLSSFNQNFASAKQNTESWVFNPTTVATRLAGYPNTDGCKPDSVSTLDGTDSSRVTVLIKAGASGVEPCTGDSVAESEIRVDLVKPNQVWEIEWAGARYRCRKGRGNQMFSPELCN